MVNDLQWEGREREIETETEIVRDRERERDLQSSLVSLLLRAPILPEDGGSGPRL